MVFYKISVSFHPELLSSVHAVKWMASRGKFTIEKKVFGFNFSNQINTNKNVLKVKKRDKLLRFFSLDYMTLHSLGVHIKSMNFLELLLLFHYHFHFFFKENMNYVLRSFNRHLFLITYNLNIEKDRICV